MDEQRRIDEVHRAMTVALQVGAGRMASGAWRLDEYTVRRERVRRGDPEESVAIHMGVVRGDRRHVIDVILYSELQALAWAEIVRDRLDETYAKLRASVDGAKEPA